MIKSSTHRPFTVFVFVMLVMLAVVGGVILTIYFAPRSTPPPSAFAPQVVTPSPAATPPPDLPFDAPPAAEYDVQPKSLGQGKNPSKQATSPPAGSIALVALVPWWIPYVVLGNSSLPRPIAQGCGAEPLIGELEGISPTFVAIQVFNAHIRLRSPQLPTMMEKLRQRYENPPLTLPIHIILFPIVSYTRDGNGCFVEDYIVQ